MFEYYFENFGKMLFLKFQIVITSRYLTFKLCNKTKYRFKNTEI